MNQTISHILKHFEAVDSRGECFEETEKGVFLTSTLATLLPAITHLIEMQTLSPGQTFCDAGSGDGRVPILMQALGFPSIGIEWDEALIKKSEMYADILLPNNAKPQFIQGDFGDVSTYRNHKVDISKIDIFFNYINNYQEIIPIITRYAHPAAKFLFLRSQAETSEFAGMTCNRCLQLKHTTKISLSAEETKIFGIQENRWQYFFVYE